MLLADDIVLIDEIRDRLNDKLEKWRHTLESRGFRLSRLKTEYLKCRFSSVEGSGGELTLGEVVIPKVEKFKYLCSIIDEGGDIESDVNHHIRLGWQKLRNAFRVLCDKKIPIRLKGRVYRMVVRPFVLLQSRVLASQ